MEQGTKGTNEARSQRTQGAKEPGSHGAKEPKKPRRNQETKGTKEAKPVKAICISPTPELSAADNENPRPLVWKPRIKTCIKEFPANLIHVAIQLASTGPIR